MWTPATLQNPPASAVPRHPPLARGALVCASTTTALTIPGGSGKERFVESHRAKLSAGTARGSLAKGSWRRRRLRDSQLALLERTNPCGKLTLCGIPTPRRCRGTPLWQGGLWSVLLFSPGNVTGHWRGSNNLLKIAVRNWLRPLAADTGRVREVAITDQLGAHCQRRLAAKKLPSGVGRQLFFRGITPAR